MRRLLNFILVMGILIQPVTDSRAAAPSHRIEPDRLQRAMADCSRRLLDASHSLVPLDLAIWWYQLAPTPNEEEMPSPVEKRIEALLDSPDTSFQVFHASGDNLRNTLFAWSDGVDTAYANAAKNTELLKEAPSPFTTKTLAAIQIVVGTALLYWLQYDSSQLVVTPLIAATLNYTGWRHLLENMSNNKTRVLSTTAISAAFLATPALFLPGFIEAHATFIPMIGAFSAGAMSVDALRSNFGARVAPAITEGFQPSSAEPASSVPTTTPVAPRVKTPRRNLPLDSVPVLSAPRKLLIELLGTRRGCIHFHQFSLTPDAYAEGREGEFVDIFLAEGYDGGAEPEIMVVRSNLVPDEYSDHVITIEDPRKSP